MGTIDTNIEIELWNVLKYITLSYLLAPVVETAMAHSMSVRNGRLVEQGKTIQLRSSWLGNISLHQEVEYAQPSSKIWQCLSVIVALAIAMPFEYASGAQTKHIWAIEESPSSKLASDGFSDDVMLLGLSNPNNIEECVEPNVLSQLGEFMFLSPRGEIPALLEGNNVTQNNVIELFSFNHDNTKWEERLLKSRKGDSGIVVYSGGHLGKQALIKDANNGGNLIVDFGTDLFCVGLLYDKFHCYDLAGKFSLSDILFSLTVRGNSDFLRVNPETHAKLFLFKKELTIFGVGDPSKEENHFPQGVNETGFEWFIRQKQADDESRVYVSTLKLDPLLSTVDCESSGAVKIRPLSLQVGQSVARAQTTFKMPRRGDQRLVKLGGSLYMIALTKADPNMTCSTDPYLATCLTQNNTLIFLASEDRTRGIYTSLYELQVTRAPESEAELVVLHAQWIEDRMRGGVTASWDIRLILPKRNPQEGARAITRSMQSSVPLSSGTRTTGTIETWAVILFGSFLLPAIAILLFLKFGFKEASRVDIETVYRSLAKQKDQLMMDKDPTLSERTESTPVPLIRLHRESSPTTSMVSALLSSGHGNAKEITASHMKENGESPRAFLDTAGKDCYDKAKQSIVTKAEAALVAEEGLITGEAATVKANNTTTPRNHTTKRSSTQKALVCQKLKKKFLEVLPSADRR